MDRVENLIFEFSLALTLLLAIAAGIPTPDYSDSGVGCIDDCLERMED